MGLFATYSCLSVKGEVIKEDIKRFREGGCHYIIGDVHIGNNVTIGAGSVVVKDIPDNSAAVGNPARVIKTLSPIDG